MPYMEVGNAGSICTSRQRRQHTRGQLQLCVSCVFTGRTLMVPNMAELPATFSDPQCVWAESERAWPEPQAEIMHPYLPCPGGTQCKARLSLWPVTVLARVIHSRVSKASDAALIQDTPVVPRHMLMKELAEITPNPTSKCWPDHMQLGLPSCRLRAHADGGVGGVCCHVFSPRNI